MMSDLKRFEHLKIQLEAIISATNNFAESHLIGKGGFGKVYKGELVHSGSHTTVAIKCLDPSFGQGDREFWNEILMLSLYKHENIVSLLGFCDHGGEKILIYEYASKRGLDLYLKSNDLTWVRRLKICIGAARGLANLHDPAAIQQRVLHRDIKSSNILLNGNWKAMIADFGLSKFCPANLQHSLIFSNPVGTFGYVDPLYIESGLLTKESDVYSFGVVLFEVLCGRLCTHNNDKSHSFTELVRKHYKENKLNEIIFCNIKEEVNTDSLKAFSTIAYQCLKRDREKRPLMNEIVKTLETALEYQVPQSDTGLLSSYQLSEEMDRLYLKRPTGRSRSKKTGDPDWSKSKAYPFYIDEEANSYFFQMFSGTLTTDEMIQILSRFKESSEKSERQIFEGMIESLFEEYKFFNKYPDRQLKLAAILFGLIINNQLVTHLTRGIALRAVLDALRKPADSKMFVFGTVALEKFVDCLIELPEYRQQILQISHLRATHPMLVANIERALATTSSGHPESDMGDNPAGGQHNPAGGQHHNSHTKRAMKMLNWQSDLKQLVGFEFQYK